MFFLTSPGQIWSDGICAFILIFTDTNTMMVNFFFDNIPDSIYL